MTCTRCANGWLTHPVQRWAVRCPTCCRQPSDRYENGWGDEFWIDDEHGGRIVARRQLPADHESQRVTPMPDWFREINDQFWTAMKAKAAIVERGAA